MYQAKHAISVGLEHLTLLNHPTQKHLKVLLETVHFALAICHMLLFGALSDLFLLWLAFPDFKISFDVLMEV